MSNLANYLRKHRFINNLTQNEISKNIGVTQALYSKLENDKANPSIRTFRKLANYFGLTETYVRKLYENNK